MTITAIEVFAWLGQTSPEPGAGDLLLMETVAEAVTEHIAKFFIAPDPITADWDLGHVIASARLWQRRKSPAGVIDLGEFGGIRVSSLDRDVESLLAGEKAIPFA